MPTALALAQAACGARVVRRLARTATGSRIRAVADGPGAAGGGEHASVVVPVLNERPRLAPCLEGLVAHGQQGQELAEVLVVDGGSTDGTQDLVRAFAARDRRVRLVDAAPVPADWNGKAWGLQVGLERAALDSAWLLTVDADVRPAPGLVAALLAHARREGVPALSVATLQELSGPAEALLHPALLSTLVYRLGGPGRAARRVAEAQANGQCFLLRRAVLAAAGGFAPVRASGCEDVTLARHLLAAGHPVGFYETEGLVSVRMFGSAADAWRNWPRSLPLRDHLVGRPRAALGLLEVTLAQALPLPLLTSLAVARLRSARRGDAPGLLLAVNGALAALRLGVLAGTARAYPHRPWTYWLSPLCDVPAAVVVWRNLFQRRHVWRGRALVSGGCA
jgi:dolichol-phosphate mannosyltransferase